MFDLEAIEFYRPALPAAVVALLVVAACAAAVWLYARRERAATAGGRRLSCAVLRVAAVGMVAWLLAGPSVMDAWDGTARRGTVTLLVDTSMSMAEPDAGPGADDGNGNGGDAAHATRWSALHRHWLDDAFHDELAGAAGVRLLAFDETARATSLDALRSDEPTGRSTRLFTALREAMAEPGLRDEPAPVFVVLSDGHDTQRARDAELLTQLAERGATVHVVPVGEADDAPRLAVQAWVDADFLFAGDTTTLHAAMWHRGLAGRSVEVELLRGGEPVARRTVTLGEEQPGESVAFELAPPTPSGQRGIEMHGYEVRARPASDEADAADDADVRLDLAQQHVFVQVSRDRIRVALFEGEPYWETRTLARVLRDDAQVELHAVHHLGPDRRLVHSPPDVDPIDPDALDAAALARFDVIVLGKRVERLFPGEQAAALVDFVREHGGGLVLARGRPFDLSSDAGQEAFALVEPIAPVTWGEQQVSQLALELTPEGRTSPLLRFEQWGDDVDALTTRLPGMLAATRVVREKSASVVLLRQAPAGDETPAMAAVAQLTTGRGRVMAVLTDGLWRWSMLPAELDEYETVYHLFWSRAVRWLATGGEFLPGQEVSVSLDRLAVEPGEPVAVTVATRYVAAGFEPALRAVAPDGEARTLTLSRDDRRSTTWQAVYEPAAEGVHRFEVRAPAMPELIDPALPLTARLAVADRSPDRVDGSARPGVLDELAAATGGQRFALDEPGRLLDELRDRATARAGEGRPRYVFARWPWFAVIIGCLALEWWLRRRGGLD